jgi:hypothetical protein
LANAEKTWDDIISKLSVEKRPIALEKIKSLIVSFITSEFYKALNEKGYHLDHEGIQLKSEQEYTKMTTELIVLARSA